MMIFAKIVIGMDLEATNVQLKGLGRAFEWPQHSSYMISKTTHVLLVAATPSTNSMHF